SGGRIIISAVREEGGNHTTVRIADSGSGIPPKLLPHLFDKERSDRAKGGSGLALIICHEMIEKMNGRIWASNNPEGGASFCYTLPMASPMNDNISSNQSALAKTKAQSID